MEVVKLALLHTIYSKENVYSLHLDLIPNVGSMSMGIVHLVSVGTFCGIISVGKLM